MAFVDRGTNESGLALPDCIMCYSPLLTRISSGEEFPSHPQVFIYYITPYAGYHPDKGSRRDLAFVEGLAVDLQAAGIDLRL